MRGNCFMDDRDAMKLQIEELREEIYRAIKGDTLHGDEIVRLSRKLDELINKYDRVVKEMSRQEA